MTIREKQQERGKLLVCCVLICMRHPCQSRDQLKGIGIIDERMETTMDSPTSISCSSILVRIRVGRHFLWGSRSWEQTKHRLDLPERLLRFGIR